MGKAELERLRTCAARVQGLLPKYRESSQAAIAATVSEVQRAVLDIKDAASAAAAARKDAAKIDDVAELKTATNARVQLAEDKIEEALRNIIGDPTSDSAINAQLEALHGIKDWYRKQSRDANKQSAANVANIDESYADLLQSTMADATAAANDVIASIKTTSNEKIEQLRASAELEAAKHTDEAIDYRSKAKKLIEKVASEEASFNDAKKRVDSDIAERERRIEELRQNIEELRQNIEKEGLAVQTRAGKMRHSAEEATEHATIAEAQAGTVRAAAEEQAHTEASRAERETQDANEASDATLRQLELESEQHYNDEHQRWDADQHRMRQQARTELTKQLGQVAEKLSSAFTKVVAD